MSSVIDLEPLVRFWRAQDDAFERVDPYWWGGVVSDRRFPHVQEANYARVDTRSPVRLAEIEEPLGPAMDRTARGRSHVVVLHPDEQTELLVEASSRGERLAWDLVMEHRGVPVGGSAAVEEIAAFDEIAEAHRDSMHWFGITDPEVVDELEAVEREVMLPSGRRWFVVRDAGAPVALAAVSVLQEVGYLDHVVTFPDARKRGFATALAARAVVAARDGGAERTYLLAEPGDEAARIYERVGFRPVTQIASWISPGREE